MWYVEAKRVSLAGRDGPPCPDCGNPMMPSKFPRPGGEYYCGRCRSAKPDPSASRDRPSSRVVPQPDRTPTISPPPAVPSPPQDPVGAPPCKMCGTPFGWSKLRPTNHFCWNCFHKNDLRIEMKPLPGVDPSGWPVNVAEPGVGGKLYTSFKGTYGTWLAAPGVEPRPVPPASEPVVQDVAPSGGDIVPGVGRETGEEIEQVAEPPTPIETVVGPLAKEETEEESVEKQVIATGDLAKGQGDLINGSIRLYSEQARASMFLVGRCDRCGEMVYGGTGLCPCGGNVLPERRCEECGKEQFGDREVCDCGGDAPVVQPLVELMNASLLEMGEQVRPGVENYVGLAPLFAMARADVQDGKPIPAFLEDIRNSPIIMDQSAGGDEEAFISRVVAHPLYGMTDIGRKGYRPNISQAVVLATLMDTMKNLTICLPTGAGKTTCAELAIANGLTWGKTEATEGRRSVANPVAVYIAPARALTTQMATDFSSEDHPFAQAGFKVRMEIGGGSGKKKKADEGEDDDIPQHLVPLTDTENPSIVVGTPERLLSCLQNPKRNPWVNRVTTFIFDEGHLIGDADRGPKFQAEQIKLYEMFRDMKRDPNYASSRIMFMSATMDNALELSSWQDGLVEDKPPLPEEPLTDEEELERMKRTNWALAWGDTKPVHINRGFSSMPVGDEEEEHKYLLNLIRSSLGKTVMANTKEGKREIVAPTLFFVHSIKTGSMLQGICRSNFRQCTKCGNVFEARKDRSGNVIGDKPWDYDPCPACGADNYGVEPDPKTGKRNYPIVQFTPGFHHRGASGKDGLVRDFNSFKSPFLIATSTLAAGVNTGAWNVHILGASRGPQDVDVASILQMAGRAGRQLFARLFSQISPDYDPASGKELPFGANVTFHVDAGRFLHHARRIQAGTFLEAGMANGVHFPDVLLLFINMGLIRNVADAGMYLGKSFDYLQAQVDNNYPMNPRLALKEVSQSGDGDGGDKIQDWKVRQVGPDGKAVLVDPPAWCKHVSIEFDWDDISNETALAREARRRGQEPSRDTMWVAHCRDCGAEGSLENTQKIKGMEHFEEVCDTSVRDLVAAGFAVCDLKTGELKITPLGRVMSKMQVPVASVVDIIRNISKLKDQMGKSGQTISEASDLELAAALTNTRKNNDEDQGAFITASQTESCVEACEYAYGGVPTVVINGVERVVAAKDPYIKMMQCVYWLLSGKRLEDVPMDLRGDFRSVSDTYGGTFVSALSDVFERAEWFKNDRTRMTSIQVQLSSGVSPEEAVFAVANGIGQKAASALVRAGFSSLKDMMAAPPSDRNQNVDPRFFIYYYYFKGFDRKEPPVPVPDATYPYIPKVSDKDITYEVKRLKKLASEALEGRSGNDYDSAYKRDVQALNDPSWIARMSKRPWDEGGLPGLTSLSMGWYRLAKETSSRVLRKWVLTRGACR